MPAPQQWMTTAKLRALYEAGRTYEEIAEANERMTGYRPTRSGVKKRLDRLNFPPRDLSHADLVPWRLRPEHISHRLRRMLQAESAKRKGKVLTPAETRALSMLNDLLFGRGTLMVIGYDEAIGFYLTDRTDADDDIIRRPPATYSRALRPHDVRHIPPEMEILFDLTPDELRRVLAFVDTMRAVYQDREGVADAHGA